MTSTCECVSLGHPDKTADAITSALLDAYLEKDPMTRYAVECQIKDNYVTLAGEVTSEANFSEEEITKIVIDAISAIGYTHEYASRWPVNTTLDASKVIVTQHISKQSPNIAQGVDNDGWGDQGVFEGMAVNDPLHGYMPLDRYYSHEICDRLYKAALVGKLPIGLDIKTQVSVDENFVEEVIVAAPMLKKDETLARSGIRSIIYDVIPRGCGPDNIIINGTGSYVIHSSIGDCGTTGRKLAVDFYGLNCPIGGGSPWSKDGTKADVALNLMARHFAVDFIRKCPSSEKVFVKMSCCIGRGAVLVSFLDENNKPIATPPVHLPPSAVIARLDLRKPIYFDLCRDGLFSKVDAAFNEKKKSKTNNNTKAKRNKENHMEQIQFKPVATKKEAYKNLTAALVVCKECKKQFVSVTKLNTCFGLKSKGGEMAKKAIAASGVKPIVKGNVNFVAKDDARKVIDFVYAHKVK